MDGSPDHPKPEDCSPQSAAAASFVKHFERSSSPSAIKHVDQIE
jgi:hypothetical protein